MRILRSNAALGILPLLLWLAGQPFLWLGWRPIFWTFMGETLVVSAISIRRSIRRIRAIRRGAVTPEP